MTAPTTIRPTLVPTKFFGKIFISSRAMRRSRPHFFIAAPRMNAAISTHRMEPLNALNTVATGTWPMPAISALISRTTAHSCATLPAHITMEASRMPSTRMESGVSSSSSNGGMIQNAAKMITAITLKMIFFFVSFMLFSPFPPLGGYLLIIEAATAPLSFSAAICSAV